MRAHLIAAIALLTLAAPPAFADHDGFKAHRLNVPRDQWLPPAEIIKRLGEKGYKVYELEVEDGAYEVELIDKDNVRIEAHVHPATAELLLGYDD